MEASKNEAEGGSFSRGKCLLCEAPVIIAKGRDRRVTYHDSEPMMVLIPNAEGVWDFEEGHIEHQCQLEGEES